MGARVDLKDSKGCTPLHRSVQWAVITRSSDLCPEGNKSPMPSPPDTIDDTCTHSADEGISAELTQNGSNNLHDSVETSPDNQLDASDNAPVTAMSEWHARSASLQAILSHFQCTKGHRLVVNANTAAARQVSPLETHAAEILFERNHSCETAIYFASLRGHAGVLSKLLHSYPAPHDECNQAFYNQLLVRKPFAQRKFKALVDQRKKGFEGKRAMNAAYM
jgi:hypothetical protein